MFKTVFFILLLIFLLFFPGMYKEWGFNNELHNSVASSRILSADPVLNMDNQGGQVKVLGVEPLISEEWINSFQKDWSLKKKAGFYTGLTAKA